MRRHWALHADRVVQRRPAPPVLQVGQGALEQEVHDGLVLVLLGGEHERGALVVVGGVEVRPAQAEQADGGQVAAQRRLTQPVASHVGWEGNVVAGQQPRLPRRNDSDKLNNKQIESIPCILLLKLYYHKLEMLSTRRWVS
eukprot:1404495-Pyramimonas_sp.AAC.3